MSSQRPPALAGALLVALTAVTLAAVAALTTTSGDYQVHHAVGGDNAGPAMEALVHGHLAALAREQPLMGLTSLLWRLPFAGLAAAAGGGPRAVYQAGSLACLLTATGLIVWLVRRAADHAHLGAIAVAAVAIALGPATRLAISLGHPEEVLATVLVTGAVLCASEQRRTWAAVLLGLAFSTKQWALLATPAVLLALPDGRQRAAVQALVVAGVTSALLPLASPGGFAHAEAAISGVNVTDFPGLWWPFAVPHVGLSFMERMLPLGLMRSEAVALVLGPALGALWFTGRRWAAQTGGRIDPLALLALLGLVRCVTDPNPLEYYYVAAVIPLAVWEAGIARRLPVVTLAVCAALVALVTTDLWAGSSSLWLIVVDGAWAAVMLAVALYLTRAALRPSPAIAPTAGARAPVVSLAVAGSG